MNEQAFVRKLARARIGTTFNQYAASELRRERLSAHLSARRDARYLLVGEAAGYRGARISGVPFTSERQLSGSGPAEATATAEAAPAGAQPAPADPTQGEEPAEGRADIDDGATTEPGAAGTADEGSDRPA